MINKKYFKPINMYYELGIAVLFIAFQIIIVLLLSNGYLKNGFIENLFEMHKPTDPIYFNIVLLFILNASFIVKGIRIKAPLRMVSSSLIIGCLFGSIFGVAFAFSESSPVIHYFLSALMWSGISAALSCIFVSMSYAAYSFIRSRKT